MDHPIENSVPAAEQQASDLVRPSTDGGAGGPDSAPAQTFTETLGEFTFRLLERAKNAQGQVVVNPVELLIQTQLTNLKLEATIAWLDEHIGGKYREASDDFDKVEDEISAIAHTQLRQIIERMKGQPILIANSIIGA
jgi:hypothetical protein